MSDHILLRCPFCFGDNVIMDKFGDNRFTASCENDGCQAIGPEAATEEDAAIKWNTCIRDKADAELREHKQAVMELRQALATIRRLCDAPKFDPARRRQISEIAQKARG